MDYTAIMSTASQLQYSIATFKLNPSCSPTKNPLTLASSYFNELFAGAHVLFGNGALQVNPLSFPSDDDAPASKASDYCSEMQTKSATADGN